MSHLRTSIAYPDPYTIPMFFGHPGSFHHQAKRVRKTLISTVLWLLYDFLSLKNDVNVPSKRNKQKHFFNIYFVGILKVMDEKSRIRTRIHIRLQIRTSVTDLQYIKNWQLLASYTEQAALFQADTTRWKDFDDDFMVTLRTLLLSS